MRKLLIVIIICASLIFNLSITRVDAYVNYVTPERIVEYFTSLVGRPYQGNYCLGFVGNSFAALGFKGRYGDYSARTYWDVQKSEGRTNSSIDNIPIGADVFFNTNEFGHIGVYVGNGEFVHAGTVIDKTKFWNDKKTGNYYGQRYLGWAWHHNVTVKSETPQPKPEPKPVTYPVPKNSASDIQNGNYYIVYEKDPNMVISTAYNSGKVADNIYLDFKGDSPVGRNNIWNLERLGDDSFKITAVQSNYVMDLAVATHETGEDKRNIHAYTWHGNNNQRWYVTKNDNNTYSLISKWNGYFVDVEGGNTESGTNIYTYHPNGTIAQRFYLEKVVEKEEISNDVSPLQFSDAGINNGVKGEDYAFKITSNVLEERYSLVSGALPSGLIMSEDGTITGVPEQAGAFPFTLRLESGDRSVTKDFLLEITDPSLTEGKSDFIFYDLETTSLEQEATVDLFLTTSKNNASFTIVGGSLPPGLSMDDTGYIYGSPMESGSYQFTVEARSQNKSITKDFIIEVMGSKAKSLFQKNHKYKTGHYKDVKPNEWYETWVGQAYEYGFMKGQKLGFFNPKGDIKNTEVITIAARIHSLYKDKEIAETGGAWYQKYVRYALKEGIIKGDIMSKLNLNSTREDAVAILFHSLPKKEFSSLNRVSDDAIPDVSISDKHSEAIYAFYRAGVLSGSDINGTFFPKSNITRAEISKVIVCMVDQTKRTKFILMNPNEEGEF